MKNINETVYVTSGADAAAAASNTLRADVKSLSFWYGENRALSSVSMPVWDRKITALIGPSGCGKSTLLRSFNRMHDLYPGNRYDGEIRLYPEDRNLIEMDPGLVRLRVGMVFQKPNPFPKSIFENVAAGLRVRGIHRRAVLDERVEKSLKDAALWNEVKDRMHDSAYSLSGGQQQRLCIARALAPQPDLLLLDEPTSALDPIATAKIEDLLTGLRQSVTVIIVTHNMQQAARISDLTGYMHMGELIEYGDTGELFTNPREKRTSDYITGRFG
ncbi:MAG: phosphate ABC transporter ATP-binding protein PstB [Gammaproteobacteria bacterium]|nr:phosphate ABC transporter ATP-binding protein PstB [Gammaproteobacteria bacterium]